MAVWRRTRPASAAVRLARNPRQEYPLANCDSAPTTLSFVGTVRFGKARAPKRGQIHSAVAETGPTPRARSTGRIALRSLLVFESWLLLLESSRTQPRGLKGGASSARPGGPWRCHEIRFLQNLRRAQSSGRSQVAPSCGSSRRRTVLRVFALQRPVGQRRVQRPSSRACARRCSSRRESGGSSVRRPGGSERVVDPYLRAVASPLRRRPTLCWSRTSPNAEPNLTLVNHLFPGPCAAPGRGPRTARVGQPPV